MIGGLLTLLGNLILIVVIGVALEEWAKMRLRATDPRDRVCALLIAPWLMSHPPVLQENLLLARLISLILLKFRSLRLRPAKTNHHR